MWSKYIFWNKNNVIFQHRKEILIVTDLEVYYWITYENRVFDVEKEQDNCMSVVFHLILKRICEMLFV